MTVASILKTKGRDVAICYPNQTLQDIAQVLSERRIGCLVVVDPEDTDRVVGIVSERDVVRALGKRGAEVLTEPVTSCMTAKVITCREIDSIQDVLKIMSTGRFRHVPVVEAGRLVGIISIGDVVKRRIEMVELEAESMRSYIATG